MKLVENNIISEIRGLLSEDRRTRVIVAIVEAFPSGIPPMVSKRFAPFGAEGKIEYVEENLADYMKEIHARLFNMDIDEVELYETPIGFDRPGVVRFFGAGEETLPVALGKLRIKWRKELENNVEILKLAEKQREAISELNKLRPYTTQYDPRMIELNNQIQDYEDQIKEIENTIYHSKLTDEESEAIKDVYWKKIKDLAEVKAYKEVKDLKFREVNPRQYTARIIENLIDRVVKMRPMVGDVIISTNFDSDYTRAFFKKFPGYKEHLSSLVNNLISQKGQIGNLDPEETLELIRYGYLRDEIGKALAKQGIAADDEQDLSQIEMIISNTIDRLETKGDFEAPPKREYWWQMPGFPDPGKETERIQKAQEIERKMEPPEEDLQEARARHSRRPSVDDELDLVRRIMYMPAEDLPQERYNITTLPREPWDERKRPDEFSDDDRSSWIQIVGFDYGIGTLYGNQKSYWGGPFEPPKKGVKSKKSDPFHAVLEWLWRALIRGDGEKKYRPEPYDGFHRLGSKPGPMDPQDQPSEVMFFDPDRGYRLSAERSGGEVSYDRQYMIWGDPDSEFSWGAGPVPHQVPVPEPAMPHAMITGSLNSPGYNAVLKLDNPTMGRTPREIKENFQRLVEYNSADTGDVELFGTQYEREIWSLDNIGLEAVIETGSMNARLYVYGYRIDPDEKDGLDQPDQDLAYNSEIEKQLERVRAAKIFGSTDEMNKIAQRIYNEPKIFKLHGERYLPYALWLAIGGGSIRPKGKKEAKGVSLNTLVPPKLQDQLTDVVRDRIWRREEALRDEPEAADYRSLGREIRVSDWEFPKELIRITIEDLEHIKAASEDPSPIIDELIERLTTIITRSADSLAIRRQKDRQRDERKRQEHWTKEGWALHRDERERARLEAQFNIIKNMVLEWMEFEGEQPREEYYLTFLIFSIIRRLVKTYEELLGHGVRPLWSDRYKYDSFLKYRHGFEKYVSQVLRKNGYYHSGQKISNSEAIRLLTGLDPNDPDDEYDITYQDADAREIRDYPDLRWAMSSRVNLDGDPLTNLDSKLDALTIIWGELSELEKKVNQMTDDEQGIFLKSIIKNNKVIWELLGE